MGSLRATLTLWFTVALAAAVLVFGVTITVLQRRASLEAQDVRLARLTSRVAGVLVQRAADGRGPLVDVTFAPRAGDTMGLASPALRLDVMDQLSLTPGLVVVVDTAGQAVYGSPEVKQLTVAGTDQLRRRLLSVRLDQERFVITLDRTNYRFVAQRVRGARSVYAVAVGEDEVDPQIARRRFATSLVAVVPVIIGLAALIGWLLAGRALRPVSHMIDELEEITDGRSLHRRLPSAGPASEELGRLANALNSLLARLEKSFASMRRFVADASHELKTPLTVMRAGVERALTDQKTNPEAMVALEETLVGVRHMTELVDALLTLARVDEGRMELHTEPVDLAELLTETYETAQILGEQAGVEVSLDVGDQPAVVSADRGRIRQLIMNLVTNAVKYTNAGGSVALGVSVGNDAVTISVRDTGIGIAPGDVDRVFDRFWRADLARSRTGDRAGIGLGLSIARWIAEAHGGSIGVTSRPGRGSVFTVTLPVRREPASGTPPAALSAVMKS